MTTSFEHQAREAARRYLTLNADQRLVLLHNLASYVDGEMGREYADSLFAYERLLPKGAYCEWSPAGLYVVHNPYAESFCPEDKWLHVAFCVPSTENEHMVRELTHKAQELARQHGLWFMAWKLADLDYVLCYRFPRSSAKVVDQLGSVLRTAHHGVYFESTNPYEWNMIAEQQLCYAYHVP